MAKASARSVAARILVGVMSEQRSLTAVLAEHIKQVEERDRGFCQQLCYGVIRWQPRLTLIANKLLKKPLKSKDADILALLLIGLYQLRELKTPPHAAISETVNAAKQLGKQWAGGLLNACLRNYQRQQNDIDAAVETNAHARFAHPRWLLERYQLDWPEQWQQICEANNQQPPMMLRVNRQQCDRDHYLRLLAEEGIEAQALDTGNTAILLANPCDVHKLPGFFDGMASVQDGAAQRVAELLAIQPGQRVLDACAAPGGKTGHILEQAPENEVIALDISDKRLQAIADNLSRLNLSASLVATDAADTGLWWDGEAFDRILVDAPCTGSGVIRRHPDIKLLRRPEDIDQLAETQKQLLDNLWPLLKPGGLMVYTTCSAFKQENEQQIEAFLQRHPDAAEVRPDRPPAQPRPFGFQRLPGDDVMDGFYYACLQRH
ncbi:16S rRNA (cytosine(967)-C(5))-methyltransferase RsmB [Methylophaga sp. OBS1]|uniref:16S rRNA (cytosine(967)-C(5))-methyltransferase RsmB n=1 Tax=Methylophaga sp. OBS1 TaxID=2991933 RepID=UPI0022588B9F|nr:16S rRNA (cytosine(967)-C(5))-methyltransferase RsmB [Methylophaga sp. OBS1]MCX4192477.1 16S rRNA (cytosine(967)-C(5))-methyltransferase RsmB [Methylophaga sp. OBS1]